MHKTKEGLLQIHQSWHSVPWIHICIACPEPFFQDCLLCSFCFLIPTRGVNHFVANIWTYSEVISMKIVHTDSYILLKDRVSVKSL
jgi:hypothetical protein